MQDLFHSQSPIFTLHSWHLVVGLQVGRSWVSPHLPFWESAADGLKGRNTGNHVVFWDIWYIYSNHKKSKHSNLSLYLSTFLFHYLFWGLSEGVLCIQSLFPFNEFRVLVPEVTGSQDVSQQFPRWILSIWDVKWCSANGQENDDFPSIWGHHIFRQSHFPAFM